MVHLDSMQDTVWGDMVKNLNWKFDFRFMLFTVSFRLMFCNAVSKEGCTEKCKIATRNYTFQATSLVTTFILFVYLGTWKLKL